MLNRLCEDTRNLASFFFVRAQVGSVGKREHRDADAAKLLMQAAGKEPDGPAPNRAVR